MKNITSAIRMTLLFAATIHIHAEESILNVWTPPPGTASNNTFSVSVRKSGDASWTDLFVYNVKTGIQSGTQKDSSMVCFDFSGSVEMKVTYNGLILSTNEIRPLSYGISTEKNGKTLSFTMTQTPDSPRKLVLRVNDSWDTGVLHILTNPPETDAPSVNDSNVYLINPGDPVPQALPEGKDTYYFQPGNHTLPRGLWVDVDLKAVHPVDGIALVQGAFGGVNLPNRFQVEAKQQKTDSYALVYDGTGNTVTGTVSVSFPPVDARFVRLTLLGNNVPDYYTFASMISEFQVFAGSSANLALKNAIDGGLPTYANAVDGKPGTRYTTTTKHNNMHVGESFFLGKDHTIVYIAPGAVVYGAIISDTVNNLTIRGRGILDGSRLNYSYTSGREEGKTGLIWLLSGTDNRVEGITLLESPMWAVTMNYSTRPIVKNINFMGSCVNADGIHLTGCTSGLVSGVFLRAPDDLFVMYHYTPGSGNTFENSVLWSDNAHVVLLGLTGNGTQPISDITFKNLDILHQQYVVDVNKFNGCFKLWANGNNTISNIAFHDIQIDPFRTASNSGVFQFRCDERNAGEGNGKIRNITLSDITYRGTGERASLLKGVDNTYNIDGVYFYNYSRNGTTVTNSSSGNISTLIYATNIFYYRTNTVPDITLTSPEPAAKLFVPVQISIQADVSDIDGQISRVDFYSNNLKIGSAAVTPWILAWNNVPAGIYNLTAVATDNAGGCNTSTVVQVTVWQPQTFESWAAEYGVPVFGGGINDSDQDGYSDLLEYALGSAPMNPSDHAALCIQQPSGDAFHVQFNHNLLATDITLNVEFSTSLLLNDWQSIKSNVFGTGWTGDAPYYTLPNESGIETVFIEVPITNVHAGFIRLRVIK
ncbi:MAG: Ig-like domain-containing protein [Kiritimatiellales bacterium]